MPIQKFVKGGTCVVYHLYLVSIRPYFHTYQGHLNIYGIVNLREEHVSSWKCLIFLFLKNYWSIANLQCYVNICCRAKWQFCLFSVIHMYTYRCQASVRSSVLSRHNKDLEWRTLKPSALHSFRVLDRLCYSSQVLNRLCYSSWTNQYYSSVLQLWFI